MIEQTNLSFNQPKLIIYTFRTNKLAGQFLESAGLSLNVSVFVIDKPNEDIPKLLSLIGSAKPDWVVGFAATKNKSRWEEYAINRFGKGRVSKSFAIDAKLKLSKPDFLKSISEIGMGQGMSTSFCNQAAFRVQEYANSIIEQNMLSIQGGFLHLQA